jgi:hypothetical protein
MSQRPRAWVSLTLGSETPSNAGREAAPTLLSCLTIHVVQHHAGLGGPEYERGGLCIKQYDAEGLLVNTETIQLCSRRKEAKTTKKRKQRPRKRCYDLQKLWFGKSLHDDEEKRVCDFVLACYYIVLIVSFLCASCFLLDRNFNSEAFVSAYMLLCVLTYTRAGVECGRVWHIFFSVLIVSEIDLISSQWLR